MRSAGMLIMVEDDGIWEGVIQPAVEQFRFEYPELIRNELVKISDNEVSAYNDNILLCLPLSVTRLIQ